MVQFKFEINPSATDFKGHLAVTGQSGNYTIEVWNGTAWQSVSTLTGMATTGNFSAGSFPIGTNNFIPGNRYKFRAYDTNSPVDCQEQWINVPNPTPRLETSIVIDAPVAGVSATHFKNAHDYQKTINIHQPDAIIEDDNMGAGPLTFDNTLTGEAGATYYITTADADGNEVKSNEVTFP